MLLSASTFGQSVSLYQQFNGRYDFTFFGNTLNPQENSYQFTPAVLTSSSASLTLNPSDVIEKAYLYWAGSGTGDFDVKLNSQPIIPQRTFEHQRFFNNVMYDYFSAFADVTTMIQSTGNGSYTLSELDVSPFIAQHFNRRTNFAGWAIIVVYKNNTLPLNQLNIYDGLQAVPDHVTIDLDNLNVIDDVGAKIGFLAWEGDSNIAVNERLIINGATLSNPPLNPANNAFNGTNSITNSNTLYNMDLDVYDIQNNIDVGDTTARIEMTSGQDFVMINAIVTKLNSQLPDATVTIDNYMLDCNIRDIPIEYTVYNLNSTNPLPSGATISIYAGGTLVGTNQTPTILQIGESVSLSQTITLPSSIQGTFSLEIFVDQSDVISELNENNNSDLEVITLLTSPSFKPVPTLETCNLGLGAGVFDFSKYAEAIKAHPSHSVTFYETQNDALLGINAIANISNYSAATTPKVIFFRVDDGTCFAVGSFQLIVKNCPPTVYNGVSVNGDGLNDTFHIDGLRDVFVNFELSVYNRWGRLVWTGNNNTPDWDGYVKDGVGSTQAPDGTYFYILQLNDAGYPSPLNGYLYLNH